MAHGRVEALDIRGDVGGGHGAEGGVEGEEEV